MDQKLITTSFTIEGYRIKQNLGIIRGITVRSRSVLGAIGAGFQAMCGGNIKLLIALGEKTRKEAFELMVKHAEELGANGIIGMRYNANQLMEGVTEVLAYGTAVIVEKI